jgi:hypothetical protein
VLTLSATERYEEWDALWNLTLRAFQSRVAKYVRDAQPHLQSIKELLDNLATQSFGILEDVQSELDTEVTDRLMRISNYISTAAIDQVNSALCNAVVRAAFELHQLPHLESRLKSVMGSILAKKIFPVIKLLAHPRRCFNTLVRTARALPSIAVIVVRPGRPSFGPVQQSTPAIDTHESEQTMIVFERSKQ